MSLAYLFIAFALTPPSSVFRPESALAASQRAPWLSANVRITSRVVLQHDAEHEDDGQEDEEKRESSLPPYMVILASRVCARHV